ncbi:MAG: hypothetical protein Q7T59_04860 [Candidatus Woesebacteria bacterium]|nr:hypothetical protein [Candidatus Woesebacteria bacterium]
MIESKNQRFDYRNNYEKTKNAIEKIETFIETHPGPFSVTGLFIGLGVSRKLAKRVVESHPLVKPYNEEIRDKSGPQKRYFSMAVLPDPTPEGTKEVDQYFDKYKNDEIRKGAREDYFELIRIRSLGLKKGKRRFIS